ncbi:hypothetical protein [Yunchengibacter salinarum]
MNSLKSYKANKRAIRRSHRLARAQAAAAGVARLTAAPGPVLV